MSYHGVKNVTAVPVDIQTFLVTNFGISKVQFSKLSMHYLNYLDSSCILFIIDYNVLYISWLIDTITTHL